MHRTGDITIEMATMDDCPTLAAMNRQLIDDEGNGSTATVPELEDRMREWLRAGTYTGYVFRLAGEIIGYALVDPSDMWMRHFFIGREHRRQGYGRQAIALLFEALGTDEIGLSCLLYNVRGLAFWRSFDHTVESVKFRIRRPGRGGGAAAKPDVVIREIEERDYPAMVSLWNEELGNSRVTAENIGSHYDRVRGDPRYRTFVALVGEEVVGFVTSVQSYAVGFEGEFMQITGIAVRAAAQGQGVGSKLLRHLEACARDIGVYNIGLNTGYKRTPAHAFYQRNGYSSGNWCFGKMMT